MPVNKDLVLFRKMANMQYSIVNLSEVKKNSDIRFDAEFFHPEYIKNKKVLSNYDTLSDFISQEKVQRIDSTYKNFDYISIVNAQLNDLNYTTEYISDNVPSRATYRLKDKDICISTVRPNRNAVAYINDKDSSNLIGTSGFYVLRPTNINSDYLYSYTKTKYFIKSICRYTKASLYDAVSPEDIKKIKVYNASNDFQEKISFIIRRARQCNKSGKIFLQQAESILLAELDMLNWHPERKLSYIAYFSEVQKAERMDAEYYQGHYKKIIDKLKNYKNGVDSISNQSYFIDDKVTPDATKQYAYIELSNITLGGQISIPEITMGNALPNRARQKIINKDLIVSSIEGSLDNIAIVNNKQDNLLCSTGFYILREKQINTETLYVYLSSWIGQSLLKRGCSGTILTNISKQEFKHIPIPKIDRVIQEKIKTYINDFYNQQRQSKQLLQLAIKAVEMAIEQDEKTAINYISTQIKIIES